MDSNNLKEIFSAIKEISIKTNKNIQKLESEIQTKAQNVHEHEIKDVNLLQTELDGKALKIGYPNYEAAVEVGKLSKNTVYAAPEDGWIKMYAGGDEIIPYYYINGVVVARYGTGHANYSTVFIPVKKGDEASCSYAATFTFFPNR